MALESVVAFWAVSLLFVLTPGADWAYAIAAGLKERTVVPAVGGMLAGHLLAIAAVAAGVAALVAGTPMVMAVLTAAGAVYLMWLGVGSLTRPAAPQASGEQSGTSWFGQAAKGMGVSALNPKVLLLILALLPQFTSLNTGWPMAVQIGALGLAHVFSCAVVYFAVGTGARRVLRARPGAARVISRISGVAMIVIGIVLLGEQLV